MKTVEIIPSGWPCALRDCPPGLFIFGQSLGFKSEYVGNDGRIDAFCVESGEIFWGGTSDNESRGKLIVQPAITQENER